MYTAWMISGPLIDIKKLIIFFTHVFISSEEFPTKIGGPWALILFETILRNIRTTVLSMTIIYSVLSVGRTAFPHILLSIALRN